MCWCTPSARTRICKNCPEEKRAGWTFFNDGRTPPMPPVKPARSDDNLGIRYIDHVAKIIAYVTAYGSTINSLEERVNEKLKEGFQPFNPVFIITSEANDKRYLVQVMVAYE